MAKNNIQMLSPRFHNVLKAIYDYGEKHGKPPYRENAWLAKRTELSSNHITQIKRGLIDLRLITENASLTEDGMKYIRNYFGAFTVKNVAIHLQGIATASPTEVSVNLDDFNIPSDSTIDIPAPTSKDVFAIQIKGISMVKEGILDGDYVIVEKQDSLWWPSPQDMIVTRYLPFNENYNPDDQISPSDYVGPVLKIYIRRIGETGCELGWRKVNDENPFIIEALALQPIGKIIGVYRNLKNFSITK